MLNEAPMLVKSNQAAVRCAAVATKCELASDPVVDAVRRCLRASPYRQVRTLSCEHREGVLVLRGQVSSFYHKQVAQEAVRHFPGVEVIINAVDVLAARQSEQWSSDVT
jgi:osmotically-inducible protein OsmY